MIDYGFQRLVLINSAGYEIAELPLDAAVSLVAPNNIGKTSLISALQFLLIIDRRRMDFGAHDFERSRRFYFPSNSSYILLEVLLPDSGTVVLGCVGKGVSHDYEYFAYRGQLKIEDYRLDDGCLVAQPQLLNHLASRNLVAQHYSGTEFTSMVYGNSRRVRGENGDFTVFRLEHSRQAEVFQRVLTRTLRLDKLQSKEVKEYLLQIFHRDMSDAGIDFKQEWDKAFADVNADRQQYQAAMIQRQRLGQLEALCDERLQLRGKLVYFRPRIDRALHDWESYFQSRSSDLQHARVGIEQAEEKLQNDRGEWLAARQLTLQKEDLLKREQERQADLERRFALVDRRETLEREIEHARAAYEAQVALVAGVQGRRPEEIARERNRVTQDVQRLQRERASLTGNLYQHLQRTLSPEQLSALNQVFARDVMTLPESGFSLDHDQLRQSLEQWLSQAGELRLPGLDLQLAGLHEQHRQRSAEEIDQELADLNRQLAQLDEQLQAAEEIRAAEALKHERERDYHQARNALVAFDELTALRERAGEREQLLSKCQSTLADLDIKLGGVQAESQQLRAQLEGIRNQQDALGAQHREICAGRDRRGDGEPIFSYLADLPHQAWVGSAELAIDQLAEYLREYQQDCRRLLSLESDVRSMSAELHSGGLTKFQTADDPEEEIRLMIEFGRHLPQEFEAIERKARSAVVNVTLCLRQLRDSLNAFKAKMRQFNQLVSRRKLSDLAVFKIETEDEQELVEAIQTLITTAEQVETGQSFELFDHASVLDDESLSRAKTLLIREGEARGGLGVEHLFRLNFIVGKEGQKPEAFADLDGAASNGTVLMAKLVTGLALLHQMQDKRYSVRAACYLDEALALDGPNQTSLIETAAEFGFALIFASPAPLATVRYCVPITEHNQKKFISRKHWQVLELRAMERHA
ncbi:hypothetical protein V0R48_15210 [Pseudomonas alcaligenes]|uniref:hypothetical protein n=1 Tax=Aquipseudomonas alcaligenes TaxID=43263 RepID=UPI002E7B6982|nr:hypothetical protein [Pseudomonas alcaligenes]MEE1950332.1 hypothetical protein [Pseudomonas alcaligenes]